MADKKPAKRGRGTKSPRKKTRKKAARKSVRKTAARKLYTLTQIGKMASVSMPTLQKYKRAYQDRIPSVGEGRKQRYPREAVAVLKQLKLENLAKRGRPRKPSAPSAKPAKRTGTRAKKRAAVAKKSAARGKGELLTLSEISRITNISYPTVSRYVKLFLERIPHVGAGRVRRFPSEAIAAFQQLRSESRPGRPPKKSAKTAASKPAASKSAGRAAARADVDLNARLKALEKSHADLSKQLAAVLELLKKPMQVTIGRR